MITSGTPPQDMMDRIKDENPSFIVQARKLITPQTGKIYIVRGLIAAFLAAGGGVVISLFTKESSNPENFIYAVYAILFLLLLKGFLTIRMGIIGKNLKGPWIANLKEGLLVYHRKKRRHIYNWEQSHIKIDKEKRIIIITTNHGAVKNQKNHSDQLIELPQFEEIIKQLNALKPHPTP
ncbi:hypothetical protein HN748_06240 [Candidatus Peregrinibacteria bacterium]|jgi:hypothetical protein|nr:hypothetical protein [Candidatus Peregrinibacteria bacterium]MBT7484375.1 hypothetical protein [Candidatus Peregrinibacteria bacterium]MBT7703802.1 hypothetical protein [Candidatus Peregrinibacteria bacterium]